MSPVTQASLPSIPQLANYFWRARGERISTAAEQEGDFKDAQAAADDATFRARFCRLAGDGDRLWLIWSRRTLKPYLAIEAAAGSDGLVAELNRLERVNVTTAAKSVRLLILLDGSPEHSRECYRRSRTNCRPPEEAVEAKDQLFHRYCTSIMTAAGGLSVEQGRPTLGNFRKVGQRRFQDGVGFVFSGEWAIPQAVGGALRLAARLAEHNLHHADDWTKELHHRVVLGYDWSEVVARLPGISRDHLELPPSCFPDLSADLQHLLRAAGVRPSVATRNPGHQERTDDSELISQLLLGVPGIAPAPIS